MDSKTVARHLDLHRSDADAVDVALTATLGEMESLFEQMSAEALPGVHPASGGDIRKMLGALGATAPASPSGAEVRSIIARFLGEVGPMLWDLQTKLKTESGRLAGDAAASGSEGPA